MSSSSWAPPILARGLHTLPLLPSFPLLGTLAFPPPGRARDDLGLNCMTRAAHPAHPPSLTSTTKSLLPHAQALGAGGGHPCGLLLCGDTARFLPPRPNLHDTRSVYGLSLPLTHRPFLFSVYLLPPFPRWSPTCISSPHLQAPAPAPLAPAAPGRGATAASGSGPTAPAAAPCWPAPPVARIRTRHLAAPPGVGVSAGTACPPAAGRHARCCRTAPVARAIWVRGCRLSGPPARLCTLPTRR